MAKIVEELPPYDNIKDFINDISYKGKLYDIFGNNFIFRGQSSDEYSLIPSSLRDCNNDFIMKFGGTANESINNLDFIQIMGEFRLLYKFFIKSDYYGLKLPNIQKLRDDSSSLGILSLLNTLLQEKWIPNSLLELAGLAQHYGVPTRLLDWSQDIFVALYFAVSGIIKNVNHEGKNKYMVLWALNNVYIDSFTNSEQNIPLKLIRIQYDGNPNLCAQKGLFTLWQLQPAIKLSNYKTPIVDRNIKIDKNPLDQLIINDPIISKENTTVLYKILIPMHDAKELYMYLQHIGYDASRLFPGYSGISKCIKEDYSF